jgi:hypothetical protein
MREKFAQMNLRKKKICGFKGGFEKNRIGIGSAKGIFRIVDSFDPRSSWPARQPKNKTKENEPYEKNPEREASVYAH